MKVPVGHHLNSHIVDGVDALNGAFIFILAALVETGHSIVEMGGVRYSRLPMPRRISSNSA